MCIMDLAISERITIRYTKNPPVLPAPLNLLTALAPSPVRIWAYYFRGDVGSMGDLLIRTDDQVAIRFPGSAGTADVAYFASVVTTPGIFSRQLLATYRGVNDYWVEGIIDSDLSKEIQRANRDISTRGG